MTRATVGNGHCFYNCKYCSTLLYSEIPPLDHPGNTTTQIEDHFVIDQKLHTSTFLLQIKITLVLTLSLWQPINSTGKSFTAVPLLKDALERSPL